LAVLKAENLIALRYENMKKLFLLFTLLLVCGYMSAQQENYGTRLGMGIEKKLHNWTFAAEGELRTIYYVRLISRGSLQLSTDYKIAKPLTVGAGYEFMNYLDVKYKDYQLRHRAYAHATGKVEWKRFTFSLREKIQFTTKDESDRIKPNGKIDTYAINPAWLSRTRLKISYDINNAPVATYLAFEANYQLNNPDGNMMDNYKLTLGATYKLDKKHSFDFYLLGNKDISLIADEEQSKFALGISYTFKLDEKKQTK